MSATNILQQIQDKLIRTYAGDVEIKSDDVQELFGPGFVNQYPDSSDDDAYDVTNAQSVDPPYTTYRPIPEPKGKKAGSNYVPFGEAKKTEKKKDDDNDEDDLPPEDEADMAAQAGEEEIEDATGDEMETPEVEGSEGEDSGVPEEDVSGGDMGDTGGDMGDAAAGDPSMGGDVGGDVGGDMGGQQEEEKSSSEIGRIYELKKIYTRLTSIEAYLGDESDQELLEIRNYVSQGIELFEIVSANFDSYKDKLDEIIVMYYKFLLEVYKSVEGFYKKEKK